MIIVFKVTSSGLAKTVPLRGGDFRQTLRFNMCFNRKLPEVEKKILVIF